MKLPENTLIAQEKLTHYLLVHKKRNDKSQWLAQAGYTLENWQVLEYDLRKQILSINADPIETNDYGQLYEIKGKLVSFKGVTLSICTIWMIERETNISKFVTMYPYRKE